MAKSSTISVMKKIILVLLAIVAVAASASIVTSNYYKKEPTLIQSLHLPLTAIVAAEEQNLIVFTNVDSSCLAMQVFMECLQRRNCL